MAKATIAMRPCLNKCVKTKEEPNKKYGRFTENPRLCSIKDAIGEYKAIVTASNNSGKNRRLEFELTKGNDI
jgi:hypothetical protein